MTQDAQKTGAELQHLLAAALPPLMEDGLTLMQTLPPWTPNLADLLLKSTGQRIFLLLQDARRSFEQNALTGYFTTAALTRSIMESATILATINRDSSGRALGAFLASAESDAKRRHTGLAKLQGSKDAAIAKASKSETLAAIGILNAIQSARNHVPKSAKEFPNMADRCRSLGPDWEFHYELTYRDLCASVHGAFWKVTHAPSIAMRAPDQGGALLYDHCVTIAYAITFWGMTVLECCQHKHPKQPAFVSFRDALFALLDRISGINDQLLALTPNHTLYF